MEFIRTTRDADNILTVTMDAPGKSVNACSPQLLNELAEVVNEIETTAPAGVIFTSAKARSFNAGADLFEIRKMDREAMTAYLALGQSIFDRIARLSVPTVAAINGDCLGGGMELALACRYRVAVDDGSVNIGLPETKLGLIPAWGGTTRLPRLIGLTRALPILLAGKTMPPRKAMKAGLVDEVVRRDVLMNAARRILRTLPKKRRLSTLDLGAAKVPALRRRILEKARAQTLEQSHGNYPAPMRLLEVVHAGYEHGVSAGLEEERRALVELTDTDATKNLLRVFFLRQAAKHVALEQVHGKAADLAYAAVIGGGTMGAGIAHALVKAGLFVRLVEVDAKAASGALGRVQKMLEDDVAMGKLDKLAARAAMNRLSPTIDWTGVEMADIVVEAVAETIAVKQDVFHRLDRLTQPHAVLASNTSSLRIGDIAQKTLHPERVVGLHFFNPVPKMPLVEIVRGPQSDDASLATAIALTGRIGKTPVLVQDAPGFVVNRILIPYLAEALVMAGEGRSIKQVDLAMKRWGMPMGPFELLDEIGLDIADHVLRTLGGSTAAYPAVQKAIESKWLGKKTGRGFYGYDNKSKKGAHEVNPELSTLPAPDAPQANDDEAIQWRLVLPMVNETAKLLDERVTDSTDTIDLATVMGLGLAPFRGGIAHFADSVGSEEIVRRLDELTRQHGERFTPAPLLRDLAAGKRPLSQWRDVERPSATTPTSNHPIGVR